MLGLSGLLSFAPSNAAPYQQLWMFNQAYIHHECPPPVLLHHPHPHQHQTNTSTLRNPAMLKAPLSASGVCSPHSIFSEL